MPAARRTAPHIRRPASESLQRRKPRWGDVGRCRVIELSRVKQPSDDQLGRLWGFNFWRHLYFQRFGRSKNTTPHNLNVSSSIFESHEANRSLSIWKASEPLSRNCFELLVKGIIAFVTLLASRFLDRVQRARWCTQSRSRMSDSSWLLCNGGAPPRTSRSAGSRLSDHRQRANCTVRHDELSHIASPCRQPGPSTARAV
jgi:hypothetical protein